MKKHTRNRRIVGALMAASLVVTACGSDDGDDADGDDAAEADDGAADDAGETDDDAGDADDADDGAEAPDDADGDVEQVEVRFAWWGTDVRHEVTNEAIELFEERNPDIDVIAEFGGFEGYFDKILTQLAGGNPPDVFQLVSEVVREYDDRGQLLDLGTTSFSVDGWPESTLAGGTVDGRIAAINFGLTTPVMLYNADMFAEYGVEPPAEGWTWDDLARIGAEIHEASGGEVYGTADNAGGYQVLEVFAKQHGVEYIDANGLAITPEIVTDYWNMWEDMRATGAATPPSLTAEYPIPFDMLINGDIAIAFVFANQLNAVRSSTEATLEMVRMPGEGDPEVGGYLRNAMQLGVAADSANPDAAVRLVDFLVNDPDAAVILGVDRGYPGNPEMGQAIAPTLEGWASEFAAMMDAVGADGASTPPPAPPGAGEVNTLVNEVAQLHMFEQASVEDAVDQFISEATDILGG